MVPEPVLPEPDAPPHLAGIHPGDAGTGVDFTADLATILAQRQLQGIFQPLIDLDSGRIQGHEGLIRGPSDSLLHNPLALFRAADQQDLRGAVERLCVETLTTAYAQRQDMGTLFINLSPWVLTQDPDLLAWLRQTLENRSLEPERVVIELTEGGTVVDNACLTTVIDRFRRAGFRLALDDLGEGFSGLRRWSELRPHYVKIDKHFISGLHQDPAKLQFVRSIQSMASHTGARVIAEGIETLAEFNLVRDLGIELGQGYFIAHPSPLPGLSLDVMDALKKPSTRHLSAHSVYQAQAGALLITARVATTDTPNEEVLDYFRAHPTLQAMAVLEHGRPVGLINRYKLLDHFSRVFIRELHGRRPCIQFMDSHPLIVDQTTPIEELSRLVIQKGRATFTDGFIITDKGEYLGLGSGYDLMQLLMQLQLAAARYANPLSQLPGNVPINSHIQHLLALESPFWAAYCDLDNFKPFNDIYGYDRGDAVILLTAKVLKECVDGQRDFLGHIGGDDFFILFQSADWEARCQNILEQLARDIRSLFKPEHVEQGGYFSEDRCGRTVFHPLPSLSIGVVQVEAGLYPSHHEVSAAAAVAKKQAKKLSGNSVFVERRKGAANASAAKSSVAMPSEATPP